MGCNMLRKNEIEEKLEQLSKERLRIAAKPTMTTSDMFRDAHLESLQKAYRAERERLKTENQPQELWRKMVYLKKRRNNNGNII